MYAVGDTHICSQWGMMEERRISAMYAMGDTHSHMFPVGNDGGEEELWHVRSGGRSVTHVPSGGWWRRGGSVSCTQWGTLTHICSQWGMMEESRICVMYTVGDNHICSQWGMIEERRSPGMYAVGDAQ